MKYYKLELTKNGSIEILEKREQIKKRRDRCGYFASLMHNIDLDAIEALHKYRLRDEQEKYFFQMKNQLGFDTQDASSELGKDGRSFILFLGLMLSSKVKHVWQTTEMRKTYKSSLDMLDELEAIRFCEYKHGKTHLTEFTEKQYDICRAFGIIPSEECLPLSIRKKLKSSKNSVKDSCYN